MPTSPIQIVQLHLTAAELRRLRNRSRLPDAATDEEVIRYTLGGPLTPRGHSPRKDRP